jgi:hypothetical protein
MYHEFIDSLQPQILAATRQRIVKATVGLHEEVGGEQNSPDERALLTACM